MPAAALRVFGVTLDATTAGSTKIRASHRKASAGTYATNSDWSPSNGDVLVSKDGGSTANIGTLPSYSNGSWEYVLTGTELSAKVVRVIIAAAAIDSDDFTIETFGNASAMYPTVYSGGAAGNLITSGTGTDQLSVTSGKVVASSVSGTVGAALSVSGTVGAALSVSGTVGAALSVSGTVGAAASVSGTVGAIAGFKTALTGGTNLTNVIYTSTNSLSVDSSGRTDVGKWIGNIATADGNGRPSVNVSDWGGTAVDPAGVDFSRNTLLRLGIEDNEIGPSDTSLNDFTLANAPTLYAQEKTLFNVFLPSPNDDYQSWGYYFDDSGTARIHLENALPQSGAGCIIRSFRAGRIVNVTQWNGTGVAGLPTSGTVTVGGFASIASPTNLRNAIFTTTNALAVSVSNGVNVAGFGTNLTGATNLTAAIGTLAVNVTQIGGTTASGLLSGANVFSVAALANGPSGSGGGAGTNVNVIQWGGSNVTGMPNSGTVALSAGDETLLTDAAAMITGHGTNAKFTTTALSNVTGGTTINHNETIIEGNETISP